MNEEKPAGWRGTKRNTKGNSAKGRGKKFGTTEARYSFLAKRAMGMTIEGAAEAVGWHTKSGFKVLRDPKMKELAEKFKADFEAEMVKRLAASAAKKAMLSAEFLEENLVDIIKNGGGHERRGEADRMDGIKTGYKVLQHPAFMPASVQNINGSIVAPGARIAFEPQWVLQQKARLALPTSTNGDSSNNESSPSTT